ncbi:jumonji superfamily protein [Rhizoctonia solani AG-1 IB]|uniref:Jumonji superfamily protein n=1 Tax=Thanatephorus cucumeris (strain AG1-IB / isolate 7/3/14) TaxID=1108050 RepID=M5BL46_THACB|nr:jumonji superfamily protein [Rhizoctonia solani AG-1 IB]
MMELKALQRCVKRAVEWSEQASQLLDCPLPPKKRSRTESAPEPQFGVDDIQRLLDEIKKLGVDAPEKARLETLLEQVQDFQQKTRPLIRKIGSSDDTAPLEMFEELVAMGKNLRLEIEELTKLEELVARLQFFQIVSTVNDNGLTLDQVEELLTRGYDAQVPTDHKTMMELNRKATFGGEWKTRAVSILAQPRPSMQDLNQLVVPVQWIPTEENTRNESRRI